MGHISTEQRYTIAVMKQSGHSQKDIASAIGKDKSVVSRELSRNSDGRSGEYRSDLAVRKSAARRRKPIPRFTDSIRQYVEEGVRKRFSPCQIVGRALLEGVPCVSHQRIYEYLWADRKSGGKLHEFLRRKGKKYRKNRLHGSRFGIVDRVGIESRPPVVEDRERLGDLEMDTIIGKDHKGAILTINDRVSGEVLIRKLEGKNAVDLAEVAIEALSCWKGEIHTITSDNGREFAEHKAISEALGASFFFAAPYHSWERGSNEHLNGLVRQYIPKGTDFETVTAEYIAKIEKDLNDRPRKRHKFKSPLEFRNEKVAFRT